MIFQLLDAFRSRDPLAILSVLIGIAIVLLSISLHESAHAYTADRLGDLTPRYQGRLTLNPLAHLDPLGTFLILVAGFGYGRPVQFNPNMLRTDRRLGTALVAVAGPLTNIVLGVVFGLSLRALFATIGELDIDSDLLNLVIRSFSIIVLLNFVLAIFNMLPIPPLDGSKVLPALLPPDMAYSLERFYFQMGQYGVFLLLALFWFGGRFVGQLINGPARALFLLVVGM